MRLQARRACLFKKPVDDNAISWLRLNHVYQMCPCNVLWPRLSLISIVSVNEKCFPRESESFGDASSNSASVDHRQASMQAPRHHTCNTIYLYLGGITEWSHPYTLGSLHWPWTTTTPSP